MIFRRFFFARSRSPFPFFPFPLLTYASSPVDLLVFPHFPFRLFPLISETLFLRFEREGFSLMFRKIISTSSSFATVPLRLALTAVFFAHGAGKVFGLFGGPGLNNFVHSGPAPFAFMRPAWLWWGAAAISELLGSVLVFFGFLTRVGAFLLACTMLTAVIGVHWPAGFFANKGGYEYPMALFAMALALLIAGGGFASVDRGLSGRRRR